MLTDFPTQNIAVVILLCAFLVLAYLARPSSGASNKLVRDLRKAAVAIERLDQEISELTDHCSDALELDMRRVRWNLLIATVRNARALSAMEEEDVIACLKWLKMAQKAVDNAHKRFYSAPECRFSGQSEVTTTSMATGKST
jgi:hypothetical protein